MTPSTPEPGSEDAGNSPTMVIHSEETAKRSREINEENFTEDECQRFASDVAPNAEAETTRIIIDPLVDAAVGLDQRDATNIVQLDELTNMHSPAAPVLQTPDKEAYSYPVKAQSTELIDHDNGDRECATVTHDVVSRATGTMHCDNHQTTNPSEESCPIVVPNSADHDTRPAVIAKGSDNIDNNSNDDSDKAHLNDQPSQLDENDTQNITTTDTNDVTKKSKNAKNVISQQQQQQQQENEANQDVNLKPVLHSDVDENTTLNAPIDTTLLPSRKSELENPDTNTARAMNDANKRKVDLDVRAMDSAETRRGAELNPLRDNDAFDAVPPAGEIQYAIISPESCATSYIASNRGSSICTSSSQSCFTFQTSDSISEPNKESPSYSRNDASMKMKSPDVIHHVDYSSKTKVREAELDALRQRSLAKSKAARLMTAAPLVGGELSSFQEKQREMYQQRRQSERNAKELWHKYRADKDTLQRFLTTAPGSTKKHYQQQHYYCGSEDMEEMSPTSRKSKEDLQALQFSEISPSRMKTFWERKWKVAGGENFDDMESCEKRFDQGFLGLGVSAAVHSSNAESRRDPHLAEHCDTVQQYRHHFNRSQAPVMPATDLHKCEERYADVCSLSEIPRLGEDGNAPGKGLETSHCSAASRHDDDLCTTVQDRLPSSCPISEDSKVANITSFTQLGQGPVREEKLGGNVHIDTGCSSIPSQDDSENDRAKKNEGIIFPSGCSSGDKKFCTLDTDASKIFGQQYNSPYRSSTSGAVMGEVSEPCIASMRQWCDGPDSCAAPASKTGVSHRDGATRNQSRREAQASRRRPRKKKERETSSFAWLSGVFAARQLYSR